MILGTELQLTAEFLNVWRAVGSSPGHFEQASKRTQNRISCSISQASVFESHPFHREDLQLVTSGVYPHFELEKQHISTKDKAWPLFYSWRGQKWWQREFLFLTDSDSAICPVTAGTMHQLYPSESRGAKVTSTQPPFTSASPSRPSATNAAGRISSAHKTTIPWTLHQPLTPRTSTGPSTPRPPWTPSVSTPTLPWEQPLKQWRALRMLVIFTRATGFPPLQIIGLSIWIWSVY